MITIWTYDWVRGGEKSPRGFVRIAAQNGVGLGYVMEADVREDIAAGRLVRILEDWTPSLSPPTLYYPGRKNPPAAFSAFIQAARSFAAA